VASPCRRCSSTVLGYCASDNIEKETAWDSLHSSLWAVKKMFNNDSSGLSLLGAALAPGQTVGVQADLNIDAAFMVASLLRLMLLDGHGVVLLAVQQTTAHYKQVLRKLGVDLKHYHSIGRFAVIPVLTRDGHAVLTETALAERIAAAVTAIGSAGSSGSAAPSASGQRSASTAASADGVKQVSIVCDDLTQLGSLLPNSQQWQGLLARLASMCGASSPGAALSWVAFMHTDATDATADALVASTARVLVSVLPLAAGRSIDVSGRIHVLQREWQTSPLQAEPSVQNGKEFWFKGASGDIQYLQSYGAT